MARKQKLNIVHGKTKLHTILSQMELSDTPHESQSEIDSSFQPISHIIPKTYFLIPKRSQRIILLRKVKRSLKKSLKNKFFYPLLRESKLIKRTKQRDIQELKHFIQ